MAGMGSGRLTGSSPRVRGLPRRPRGRRRRRRIIPARAGFTNPADAIISQAKGSSPRVRGLPGRERHQPHPRRIIPARAGFTRPCTHARPRPRDHPRACGVYPARMVAARAPVGSSPRVRGLPGSAPQQGRHVRIIPARAGFTLDELNRRGGWLGSSPRVRGLRQVTQVEYWRAGIIPACAGFTRQAPAPGRPAPDHPRMRGVYVMVPGSPPRTGGSSPHARGLPLLEQVHADDSGIIPACAGFTARPRHHPPPGPGSSPHARGLRVGGQGVGAPARIIPACAGFTWWWALVGVPSRDHPRMRGVYGWGTGAAACGGGSSPHARGLRYPPQLPRPERRIIPACAGFTGQHDRRHHEPPDHPRMRGVYDLGGEAGVVGAGSSPHARGLHQEGGQGLRRGRIIPACAGFTWRRSTSRRWRRDHPRMRGVYASLTGRRIHRPGSSPHARGLRPVHRPGEPVVRIIPACAGFTLKTSSMAP